MSTSYPGTLDSFTNPSGTSTVDVADHAAQHSNANDTLAAIETTLGTTAGTSVLKNFAAGQFPIRNTGGGATGTLVQTIVGGTLSTTVINNPTVGTPTITGGTATTPVINNGTLGTPTVNVGSDASGDMYYRNASNVFTRLAIGAANTFLTTNGTTPSWAAPPIGVGTFSKDLSVSPGTTTISSLSFTPKVMIFMGAVNSGTAMSVGFDNGTTRIAVALNGAFTNWTIGDPAGINLVFSAGNYSLGSVTGFNSTGGTIVFTKTGTPTGNALIGWIALG